MKRNRDTAAVDVTVAPMASAARLSLDKTIRKQRPNDLGSGEGSHL